MQGTFISVQCNIGVYKSVSVKRTEETNFKVYLQSIANNVKEHKHIFYNFLTNLKQARDRFSFVSCNNYIFV